MVRRPRPPLTPTLKKFRHGICKFRRKESRDALYNATTRLLKMDWSDNQSIDPRLVAEDLGVLLLTWNRAYYRSGKLSFDDLAGAIRDQLPMLKDFRSRKINSWREGDEEIFRKLFKAFDEALRVPGDGGRRHSPVSVSKALHLLCPDFFPLWDQYIAAEYGCSYKKKDPLNAYIRFVELTKDRVGEISKFLLDEPELLSANGFCKTPLKLFDEYNYATITLPKLEAKRKSRQRAA